LRRMNRERIFAPITDDSGDEHASLQTKLFAPWDPIGDLTRRERIDSLLSAIATLPLHYREVVVLCELQELSYAETARVIGCPEGTVRSRLHRARILLLDKLSEKEIKEARIRRIEPARCSL